MKTKVVNYEIDTHKNKDLAITLVGDFHDMYLRKSFDSVILDIKKEEKDLLLIAGDICNAGMAPNHWNYKNGLNKIKEMVKKLKSDSPVILILGNHDTLCLNKEGLKHFLSLNELDNVYALYNTKQVLKIKNQSVKITGYTSSQDAYVTNANKVKRMILKDKDKIIKKEIETLKNLQSKGEDIDILLTHDPRNLRNETLKSYANQYDVILSAHMHNGYMPLSYTSIHEDDYDCDFLYYYFKKESDKHGYVRGVIYGLQDNFVMVDQLGNYYYKENETFKKLEEKEALLKIKEIAHTPLVITTGINKYVGLPLDYGEITKIKIK